MLWEIPSDAPRSEDEGRIRIRIRREHKGGEEGRKELEERNDE